MGADASPSGMSPIEWLVALEEIKLLKAKRDRVLDAHDFDAYASLHAPDHVSHHEGGVPWTSCAEMIKNVRAAMAGLTTAHHSFTPEITFHSPTHASGTWAMSGAVIYSEGEQDRWRVNYGYYDEEYEKREGRWLFTSRRWRTSFAITSEGTWKS